MLKEGDFAVARPNDRPIAGVRHMAFVSSLPLSGECMHIMPLFEHRNGCRGVLDHQFDDLLELGRSHCRFCAFFLRSRLNAVEKSALSRAIS